MKRFVKVFLLIIILGVPVFWYLFLQSFGENEFQLEVLETEYLPTTCASDSIQVFFTREPETPEERNQFRRIKQYAQSKGIAFGFDGDRCVLSRDADLQLVDRENNLRGLYSYEILEVDRAMIEIDLLLEILGENGSGN